MRYFQIRTSKHSCLDMVLQEISKEVWLKTKNFVQSEEDSGVSYFQLSKMIADSVHSRTHKYPNCGLTEACHDEIEGGPWMDYEDKIYMLSLDGDLDGFICDMANRAVNSIADNLPDEQRSELYSLIFTTLTHEFDKYLYFNPVCRHITFCELQL